MDKLEGLTHQHLVIIRNIQTALTAIHADQTTLIEACRTKDNTTARAIISTQVDSCSYLAKQFKELRKELTE